MQHRIFILMGKSAAGKDSIYQALMQENDLPLRKVVPYTTRPIRSTEEEGREYHFVPYERFEQMRDEGKIIEYREYDTCYGPWYYFTADDGQIDLADSDYLMIGTLESFVSIRHYFGPDAVIPLYVEVDNRTRLERARRREAAQAHPRFDEMERRFRADEADFSEEKLQEAGITRRFENRDLVLCTRQIGSYIRSFTDDRQVSI